MQLNQSSLEELIAQLNRLGRIEPPHVPPEPPLPPNRGGASGGGMEDRVVRLETHIEYVRRDLDGINSKLDKLIDRASELPTKADLNTWRWQWIATGLAIVALTVGGITGGLALIARFAG